jgi:Fe-S cluster biogenesis protein NfuA
MIHIENTPNPNALKFLSEKKISSVGTREFQKANIKKINNYFIKNLLNLDGVELVLVSENFLSVKKNEKISWDSLKPSIISSLNDYFQKNEEPILSAIGEAEPEQKIEDNKTIDQINNILNTKIRPAVARDGGDIKFVSFDNGIVKVELRGSCSGCPSSLMTLKQGVQNLLCHYVKEVKSVEAI